MKTICCFWRRWIVGIKRIVSGLSERKRIDVCFARAGMLSDEEFYAAMACDDAAPLYRGMREMFDRAEDQLWSANDDQSITREQRADVGIAAAVIRQLRRDMESSRSIGVERMK